MDQKVHMPRSHRALCLKDQNVHVHKVLKSQSSLIEGDKQQYRPKWYCVYKIAKKLRLHLDGKSPIFFTVGQIQPNIVQLLLRWRSMLKHIFLFQ